jgi:hypothetical protein
LGWIYPAAETTERHDDLRARDERGKDQVPTAWYAEFIGYPVHPPPERCSTVMVKMCSTDISLQQSPIFCLVCYDFQLGTFSILESSKTVVYSTSRIRPWMHVELPSVPVSFNLHLPVAWSCPITHTPGCSGRSSGCNKSSGDGRSTSKGTV